MNSSNLLKTVHTYTENSSSIHDLLKSRAFVFTCYATVVVLSVLGNSIVILVVLRYKSLRSITNLFITNLAVSDLLMTLVAAPFTPIAYYMEDWTLPHFLCKLLGLTMGVSVYVSTLTSTAIAVDRYLVIVHPFFPKMKMWMFGTIIATIWLISIIICLPLAVYTQIIQDAERNITVCSEEWPKGDYRMIFTILSFVFQFVVPSLAISICYFYISQLLKTRRNQKIGSNFRNAQKEELENRRHRKTNRMLIAMVVTFVVCWIPLNGLWILTDMLGSENFAKFPHFQIIFFACHILAMSSAVYNPLLYAWLNENFKKNFQNLIPCLFSKARALRSLEQQPHDPQSHALNLPSNNMNSNTLNQLPGKSKIHEDSFVTQLECPIQTRET